MSKLNEGRAAVCRGYVMNGLRDGPSSDAVQCPLVRYWHLADIDLDAEHVCFRGQSGHP
jgi:hypothetical protein